MASAGRVQTEGDWISFSAAAGTIPSLYISAIAVAAGGAAPVGLADCYNADTGALAAYAAAARTRAE